MSGKWADHGTRWRPLVNVNRSCPLCWASSSACAPVVGLDGRGVLHAAGMLGDSFDEGRA